MTVKHILGDGDMVFVHSQVSATPENEMSGTNRYDFYRLDHGWIVEHWVVQGAAPTRSATGNSAFSNLYAYPVPMAAAVAGTRRDEPPDGAFAVRGRVRQAQFRPARPHVGPELPAAQSLRG
ncbi:hypothetical protein LP419_12165 [Massilia sp. H-1]|nr:hypothetical protein LP419_12165 [Massilia sp. H-1]